MIVEASGQMWHNVAELFNYIVIVIEKGNCN